MKSILWNLVAISLIIIGIGCGGDTQKKTVTDAPTPKAAYTGLPSITTAEMKTIYEQADYIDLIFYNMDFSMSVNEKSNVQRVVSFIDPTQPDPSLTCPTMGRIIFQKNGEILIEADMHYTKDCKHFILYKDGKKAYAHNMSEQGKAYFAQIFAQVKVEQVN